MALTRFLVLALLASFLVSCGGGGGGGGGGNAATNPPPAPTPPPPPPPTEPPGPTEADLLAEELEGLPLDEFYEVSFAALVRRDPEEVVSNFLTDVYPLDNVGLNDLSPEYAAETFDMYRVVLRTFVRADAAREAVVRMNHRGEADIRINGIPVAAGGVVKFAIDWEHNIVNAKEIRARGGYEYFKEDDNYVYTIAQWYPRVAAFTDVTGWQNKQFQGESEFVATAASKALQLGDGRLRHFTDAFAYRLKIEELRLVSGDGFRGQVFQ